MTRKEIEEKRAEEEILALRKKRCILLEEIHEKQRLLDQVDYQIYQEKEKRRNKWTEP